LVGVKLERSTSLVALKHVLDHAVAEGSILVGHVDRCAARTIAEARDVVAEWNVLTRGLTDGGYIDFGPVDFKAPVTDLSDYCERGVGDLESVRANSCTVVGDGDCRATQGCGHLQHSGAGGVTNNVIGGRKAESCGKCACACAISLSVDHTKLHGITYFQVQVGSNSDGVWASIDVRFRKTAGCASRLIVEGT